MPKVEKNYRSQRYRKEWENESWALGWLSAGKSAEKAHCTVCDKELAAGKSELIGHTKTSSHIRFAKQIQSNERMTTYVESKDEGRIKAELNVVAMMARKKYIYFNLLPTTLLSATYILPCFSEAMLTILVRRGM